MRGDGPDGGAKWRHRQNDETASRCRDLAGGCWRNERGSRLFLCCLVRLLWSWGVVATLRTSTGTGNAPFSLRAKHSLTQGGCWLAAWRGERPCVSLHRRVASGSSHQHAPPRDERGPEAARGGGRRLRRADKHQAVRRAGRAAQIPAGQACQAQEEARRGRRRRRRRRCGACGVAGRAQEGEDGRAQAEPRRGEGLRSTCLFEFRCSCLLHHRLSGDHGWGV